MSFFSIHLLTTHSSLVGYPPFGQSDFDAIRYGRYNFNHARWKKVSAAAKDLVSNLLVVDPHKRFTIENILDHAWIKGDFDAFAKPAAKSTKRKSEPKAEKGADGEPAKAAKSTSHRLMFTNAPQPKRHHQQQRARARPGHAASAPQLLLLRAATARE